MSNSSVPKPQPNRLRQETLEKVLETLRQPIAIAAIGSIVAHGLLWAALPTLLADQTREPDSKQTVGLVELSPAEQSQLPQFATNSAPQPLFSSKPLPSAPSALKLPDPKRYNNPSIYDIPILQPPPPFVLPSDPLTLGLDSKKPSAINKARKPTSSDKPAPPKPPNVEQPNSGKGTAETKDDPAAPARSNKLSPEQIAALQQDAAKSSQLGKLYAFNGPSNNAERADIGAKNSTKFYDSAARLSGGNYKKKYYGTPFLDKGIISDLFPKEACPYVRETTIASVAAIITPDAKLAEPPSILVPSGFKGLDSIATEYVAKKHYTAEKDFRTDGNYQIIRFNFIFDPKTACSASDKPA